MTEVNEKGLWDRLHKPVDLSALGQRIFVLENYFDNVDEIRAYSLTKTFGLARRDTTDGAYTSGAWKGYKTDKFTEETELERNIISKIKDTLKVELPNVNVDSYRFEAYFQYMLESTKETFEPSFEENPFHRDAGYKEYAGVIYLNPGVDPKYGTNVNGEFVENIYNRFVCYPAHAWHGPADMFGDSVETARMALVFFLYENLTERMPTGGAYNEAETTRPTDTINPDLRATLMTSKLS